MTGFFRRLFGRRAHRAAPDPEAFLAGLREAALGRRYTKIDRYRDFRAVFLATRQGRRVLWQILEWAHVYRSVAVRGDSHQTYFRDGERNVGLRILAVTNAEPGAQPEEVQAAPEQSSREVE
ncbi:MAG: hypothetical protein RIB59_04955 [Rhodospirillales bacterium]